MEKLQEKVNKEYKVSAFTAYFGTPRHAADLYRALGHEPDIRPEDIQYTTLKDVLFMARKNDLAFTVKKKILVIGEHQSTVNANMPLRDAIYYGRTLEKLVPSRALYKNRRIWLPTPEFYVFYNGTREQPPESVLHLADAYLEKTAEPMLQLDVKVINVNPSAKHPILEECRSMYEYSWFVQRIRDYTALGHAREEAILRTLDDCMKEGILVDFITEYGTEVKNMLFTEFNMEDALEVRGEEKFEEGLEQGFQRGTQRGEQRFAELTRRLLEEDRSEALLKAASDEGFRNTLYLEYQI